MKRAVLTSLAILLAVTIGLAFAPAIAFAHPGHANANGLVHGFIHPATGFDHVLAMVAVGVLAAQLGGRALWLVPLSFVAAMAFAGALGMAGIQLPFAEVGIALSVVVLGLAIAFAFKLSALVAMALVGFFALFHGYVHGVEMPDAVSAIPYAAGFVAATALLHAVGVSLGLLLFGFQRRRFGHRVVQAGGGAMALFGVAILVFPSFA
jgi:urease accessory protein